MKKVTVVLLLLFAGQSSSMEEMEVPVKLSSMQGQWVGIGPATVMRINGAKGPAGSEVALLILQPDGEATFTVAWGVESNRRPNVKLTKLHFVAFDATAGFQRVTWVAEEFRHVEAAVARNIIVLTLVPISAQLETREFRFVRRAILNASLVNFGP